MNDNVRIVTINGELHHNKFVKNKISTTKYNVLSFVPRFLYEQFRKYANCYFLCIALLQQIPDVSPTGRFTTLIPFIIILSISAIKEIIEDIKRRRSDDVTNNKKVLAMTKSLWSHKTWSKLEVGTIVRVESGENFPADLVLLSSSEPKGVCYIETANLDGETNLKVRQALTLTTSFDSEEKLSACRGRIQCELPNKFLYDFVGNVKIDDSEVVSLGSNQLLLRGSLLKNTKWIFGCVVYSGYDTKLMLNSSKVPLKRSTVEKVVNKQILMLFCILLIMAWISAIGSYLYQFSLENEHWYLAFKESNYSSNFFFDMLTFVILYNNLIPISLQVTLEMVKFTQAIFIGWDREMHYDKTDTSAAARTSNLNEELGQIKYIFSDKTGTLTGNIMSMKMCAVDGKIYGKDFTEPGDNFDLPSGEVDNTNKTISISEELIIDVAQRNKEMDLFLLMCAACHTVVPEMESLAINYQAASPDEKALVLGAVKCGYKFVERTPDSITIEVNGKERVYTVLTSIEFTSTRKRMTTILKDDTGVIKVFCKGADNEIFKRLEPVSKKKADKLNKSIIYFSQLGLRTLCFAEKSISKAEYLAWKEKYTKASNMIKDRQANVDKVATVLEQNFQLVGASAIEDKLQDGVPECIHNLLAAGISLWMLTGDKEETAINIGTSCKLLNSETNLHIFHDENIETALQNLTLFEHQLLNTEKLKTALIINGKALTVALEESCRDLFLSCALKCKSVICCRVSPSQKSEIVRLVKEKCNASTLAIGDGANDVGMIQEAHIGVGISGEEGLQAVCASDYSIAQFRFLQRLILVHGNWNYNRVTKLILFCFYKNICFYFCEFWYAFLSAFSGQVIFERWTIAMYNVIFTAFPPLAIGLFDKSASEQTLLSNPHYYLLPQSSEMFNVKIFWLWCLNSVYVSLVVFWLPMLACRHDTVFSDGKVGSYLFVGNIMYTIVIMTMSLKALLECQVWNTMIHILIHSSTVLWLVFFLIYCRIWPVIKFADKMVGMDYYMLSSWIFWFLILLVPFTALLRDIVSKVYYGQMFPGSVRKSRNIKLKEMNNTRDRASSFEIPIEQRSMLTSTN